MSKIEKLEKQIQEINARNYLSELDQEWEKSFTKKGISFALVYLVIVIFFYIANLSNPWREAIVPALAYILSTQSMSFLKKLWAKYIYKHKSRVEKDEENEKILKDS